MATLTYAYADQTAVVGPLAEEENPHSWDLCEAHSERITAPRGWELVRVDHIEIEEDGDEELMALAEAVREAGQVTSGLVAPQDPSDTDDSSLDPVTSNHPVHRSRRVAAEKTRRRAHLHVVPDPEENSAEGDEQR